jgi:hypothetical protein
MRKTFKLFSFLASFAFAGSLAPVMAQTAAATPAAAAAAATPTAVPTPAVTVDGLVDTYFSYNFSNPSSNPYTGNNSYWYNSATDSYALGLAEVKVAASQGAASAHVVLAYGEEAGLGPIGGSAPDVLQAYVSYNPGQWTFNVGRMVAWMGYEVIESVSNANYSHSLLFGELPYWDTGLSVNFAPSSTFNATFYAMDGWSNDAFANGFGETLGLEAVITPNSMWGITLNGILSPYTLLPTEDLVTVEGIVSYKPNSTWSFALDGQFGTKGVAAGTAPSYFGVALYGKYQIQSDWDLALRLEYVNDSDNDAIGLYGNGAPSGNAFTGDEGTLTIEHDFTPNLIARVEGRLDMANYDGAAADVFDAGTSSSQFTGTASLAYTF